MQKTILNLGVCALLAAAVPASADTVDAKLLGMLRDNGSITAAQYTELSADLEREQRAVARESVDKAEVVDLEQKLAWATRTVVSGDVRVRQDRIEIQHANPDPNKDRQRIRARLGAVSQVTPTVESGIRIASGNNNDLRSTNQDLDNYFTKKDIWLDRAYINWHPTSVPGLKLFGGKMAQPWVTVGDTRADAVWDQDINPEGIAALYSRKFGDTELFGSIGGFTLKNNVDGNGNEFHNDARLQSAQLGVRLFPGDDYKVTVGSSVYHYYNDSFATAGLALNGNTTTQFQIYEGFGQLDVLGLPLPLSIYGQVAKNTAANGPQKDKDGMWLVGLITRIWDIGVNYNYRDVERNSVVGAFTDSDFAAGFTASRGSRIQLIYNITNTFTFTTTYFDAVSNASGSQPGANTDTLMIDLQAVF